VQPQALNAYKAFKDLGTVEAFEWYKCKNGIHLPATCKGPTRSDSLLLHFSLVRHVVDMDVTSELEINVHTPFRVHFDFVAQIEPPMKWDTYSKFLALV